MRRPEVTVIDYGMGNLLSVKRALEHVGAIVEVSADPERITLAERVVLPGVGAFPDAMTELTNRGLVSVIRNIASSGTPLLGICLGMQVFFEMGFEFGKTDGLGLLPGRVVAIPAMAENGQPIKVPHVGWNSLHSSSGWAWTDTILTDVLPSESAVYFVHSFMAIPSQPKYQIADCNYRGIPIAALVRKENVVGCQFHPEKSGEVGLSILRRFCFGTSEFMKNF